MEEVPGTKETLFLAAPSQRAGANCSLLERVNRRPVWLKGMELVTPHPQGQQDDDKHPPPTSTPHPPRAYARSSLLRKEENVSAASSNTPNTKVLFKSTSELQGPTHPVHPELLAEAQ